jgi:hypothetical protein
MALWPGRRREPVVGRAICDSVTTIIFASGARQNCSSGRRVLFRVHGPMPASVPPSAWGEQRRARELTASCHAVLARLRLRTPGHPRSHAAAGITSSSTRETGSRWPRSEGDAGARGRRAQQRRSSDGHAAPAGKSRKGCYPVRDDPQAAPAWPIRRATSCTITYPSPARQVGENDADGLEGRKRSTASAGAKGGGAVGAQRSWAQTSDPQSWASGQRAAGRSRGLQQRCMVGGLSIGRAEREDARRRMGGLIAGGKGVLGLTGKEAEESIILMSRDGYISCPSIHFQDEQERQEASNQHSSIDRPCLLLRQPRLARPSPLPSAQPARPVPLCPSTIIIHQHHYSYP